METLPKEKAEKRNELDEEEKKALNNAENPKEENDLDEVDLKSKYCKKYSRWTILKKSSQFSLNNWRFILCNILNTVQFQYFSLYLPIKKKRMIDAITKQKNFDFLLSTFKMYILLVFLRLITIEILHIFSYYFIGESKIQYDNTLLRKIPKKAIFFFDVFKTGELVERLEKSEGYISNNFIAYSVSFAENIFRFCFIVCYLYQSSKLLTFACIGVFFLKSFLDFLSRKFSLRLNVAKANKSRDKFKNKLIDFITHIKLIKSFTNEEREVNKMLNIKKGFVQPTFGENLLFIKIIDFINECSDTFIIFVAGASAIQGTLTYGDLSLFQTYSNQLKNNFKKLSSLVNKYENIFEGWKRFFEVYDFEEEEYEKHTKKTKEKKDITGNIKFDNVSFSYPIKPTALVLKQLSFEIKQGTTVAIVGHSGSGKSTITNLIERFYNINEGAILLDGIDIRNFNLTFLRKQIGIVEQEPSLYTGTIKENILFGSKCSDEEFHKICSLTNVSSFVNNKSLFPLGYATIIGDRGVSVSGGQKQRIAIARALVKKGKILIFDEATSALDAESENEVQCSIDNVIKSRMITTIIIAHRLCTIKNADLILFLNEGRICEKGTHEEMIDLNGEYKKLIQKQLI